MSNRKQDDGAAKNKKKIPSKRTAAAPSAKKQKVESDDDDDDDDADKAADGPWELGNMRKVTISEFKGKTLVNIREYYRDPSGEEKPGKKGISLSLDQWKALAKAAPAVTAALKNK